MKVLALSGIILATALNPGAVKQENFTNSEIINGNYFPSKKWVDFYDLTVLVYLNGKYRILYVVGNEIPAYLELDGEIKAFMLDNGRYVNVKLEKQDIEEAERMFMLLGDIHNI